MMELEGFLWQMRTSGFCVIPDVIPAGECAEIRERILGIADQHGRHSPLEGVRFVAGVVNHDQSFAPYLADEPLMTLLRELLGEHVRISFTTAIINLPGNLRGGWHSDWPFNQANAGHIRAPYPDSVMHVTTLWMLSPFALENGGTFVAPGSHRYPTNPTAGDGPDPTEPLPGEMNVTGPAGSVLVMDSRLWHATSPNRTPEPRVALAVRYAPWWLNLEILRPDSDERRRMVEEPKKSENLVPAISREAFERLPPAVQPLYRHWVISIAGTQCIRPPQAAPNG